MPVNVVFCSQSKKMLEFKLKKKKKNIYLVHAYTNHITLYLEQIRSVTLTTGTQISIFSFPIAAV